MLIDVDALGELANRLPQPIALLEYSLGCPYRDAVEGALDDAKALLEVAGEPVPFVASHGEERIHGPIHHRDELGAGLGRQLLTRAARKDVVHPENGADVEGAVEAMALLKAAELRDVGSESPLVDRARVILPLALEPSDECDVSAAHLAT